MIKIIILGGGFGGIRAALDLNKKLTGRKDIEITLVDRNGFHTFTPLIYEVAMAHGTTDKNHPYHTELRSVVSVPFGDIFNNKKVNTVQAEIEKIDLTGKRIFTRGGEMLNFDYLIIALGSEVSDYGIPGVCEYAHKFKTVNDAIGLFDKIEELYDEGTEGKRQLPINFIIAGGGFTGIEIASELAVCSVHAAHRHKIFEKNCASIIILEAKPQMLNRVSDKDRIKIKRRLKNLGVNILENSRIEEVGSDWVKIKNDKKLKADLIVWTAGVKASSLISSTNNLKINEHGRVVVNSYLQLENNPNIFIVGDAIAFNIPRTNELVPQMAYTAVNQGRVAADNIARLIRGDNNLKKYIPGRCTTWVAPLGGKNAIAHVGGISFGGLFGHFAREVIDLSYFMSILSPGKAWGRFWKDLKVALKK